MILENLLQQSPEEVLIHLERRVNNENFTADVPVEYQFKGSTECFELPFILVSPEEIEYYEINPDSGIKNLVCEGGKVRFFIHPAMCLLHQNRKLVSNSGIQVSPTSSTRTVLTRNLNPNFMVKTDLERRIGDGVKRLKGAHVKHSIKIGQDFQEATLPTNLAYLPESIGAICSSSSQETGLLIRELHAHPVVSDKRYILPLFSLFSPDKNNLQDPLLLYQLIYAIDRQRSNALDIFLQRILIPYLDSWARLISERGLSTEMHAQNILLEIDANGVPSRLVYRDFQDTFVDIDIRMERGLSTDFSKNVIGKNERIYVVNGEVVKDLNKCKQISYSLTYDYRIGRALDYFADTLKVYGPAAKETFIDAIKEVWNRYFAGTGIFPKKAYCLKKTGRDLNKELTFSEEEPKYR